MSFLDRVLDQPSYGFIRNGRFYRPSHAEIFREFFSRLNLFKTRKNWLPFFGWATTLSFAIPLACFFYFHFSWTLLLAGFLYSMVGLGTHGTIWLHRYGTHRAFRFSNPIARFFVRNLTIKIVPDEIYIISHHVHHRISEKPGDPYNVHGGWLYCFLADVNHQLINRSLNRQEYAQLCKLVDHLGMKINSYEQYQKWGSLCHPLYASLHYLLSWTFWYGLFYLIGGHALATALFGMAGAWAIGVRTFNYEGHGKGLNKQREGIDFHKRDLSINQFWPGYVSGEWHNNHHLFPNSARCGFLRYQLDLAWVFIYSCSRLGIVSSYRDNKPDFVRNYYLPYLNKSNMKEATEVASPVSLAFTSAKEEVNG
jgi:stearoyl-CoA desaturase (delta-9 desaturase)